MVTCVCGQSISNGDAFCTACGRPAAVADRPGACPKCGHQAAAMASFCSNCGTSVAAGGNGTGSPPQGFQWKWALITIPIVVCVALGLSVLAGVWMAIAGVDLANEASSLAFGVGVLLVSMLLGGFVAGWLSPGRTILEPGVGIAAALTGLNLATGQTDGLVLGWILPLLLGAGGAQVGEWLSKQFTKQPR